MDNSDKNAGLKEFILLYKELAEVCDCRSDKYYKKDVQNNAYKRLLQCYQKMKSDATVEDVKKKIPTESAQALKTESAQVLKEIMTVSY